MNSKNWLRSAPMILLLGVGNAGAMESYVLRYDTRTELAEEAGRAIAAQGDAALDWIRADLRIRQPAMPAYAVASRAD